MGMFVSPAACVILAIVICLASSVDGSSSKETSAASYRSEDYLVPNFHKGESYSNVFSILSSRKVNGYDERVVRNGGSADYVVRSSTEGVTDFYLSYRYDGNPPTFNEDYETRDAGKTSCTFTAGQKKKCAPYLDASGLIYNPALWGDPPKTLSVGSTWTKNIAEPWELGGKQGTETVTVLRIDPASKSITLMREGAASGLFASEPETTSLNRTGQAATFKVVPGTAHWKGYTTYVKGLVFSDALTVTRTDELQGADGEMLNSDSRRIMLLNASPYPTLR